MTTLSFTHNHKSLDGGPYVYHLSFSGILFYGVPALSSHPLSSRGDFLSFRSNLQFCPLLSGRPHTRAGEQDYCHVSNKRRPRFQDVGPARTRVRPDPVQGGPYHVPGSVRPVGLRGDNKNIPRRHAFKRRELLPIRETGNLKWGLLYILLF